jgi:large subunit ribosomal protein L9
MVELILLEKVAKLGAMGEIVRTKPGYARNFLIPQGKARRATAMNKKYFEDNKHKLELAQADKVSQAEGIRARVEGMTVQVARKAGVDGRLFGSVSQVDIVAALVAQGINGITKSMILMPNGHLKAVGDFKLVLHIQTEIEAQINVSVLGEHN